VFDVSVIAVVTQHLLKNIPAEEYQLLPIVMAILMIFPLIVTTLTGGFARFVTEAVAIGDEERVTTIISSIVPALFVAALGMLIVGAAISVFLPVIIAIPPDRVGVARFILLLSWFSASLQLPFSAFTVGIAVRQKFVLSNAIRIASSLVRNLLLVSLIFSLGPRIEFVVIASVVGQWLGLFGRICVSRQVFPHQRVRLGKFRWDTCRELMAFGGWSSVGQLAGIIRNAADPIILNRFATPIDVTSMHVGGMPDRYIRQFSLAAVTPLMPALTAMHAKEQYQRLRRTYFRGARLGLVGVLFVACPLMVFPWELIRLYLGAKSETYSQAPYVVLITLCSYFLTYPRFLLPKLAIASGKLGKYMTIVALLQATNLAITLLLVCVFEWGAIGSATAMLASNLIVDPLFLWPYGLKLVGGTWTEYVREVFLFGLKPFGCSLAVGLLYRATIPLTSPGAILMGVVACVGAYGIAELVFGHPSDLKDIATVKNELQSRIFPS